MTDEINTDSETHITMIVTKEQLPAAQRIFRALDPDIGGWNSFGTELADGTFMASMPVTEAQRKLYKELLADSNKLEEFVKKDYDKRWTPTASEKLDAKTDLVKAEFQKELTKEEVASLTILTSVDMKSFAEVKEAKILEGKPIDTKVKDPKDLEAVKEK